MRELIEGMIVSLKHYKTFPLDAVVDVLKPTVLMVIIPLFWLGVGSIGEWNVKELFLYTAASYLLLSLNIYVAFHVLHDIRTGRFQVFLTKPMRVPLLYLGGFLGGVLLQLIAALLLFLWLYTQLGGKNILSFLLGLFLGLLFYLLLGIVLGYLGAWMYTIWGVVSLFIFLPSMIFGGSLVPLDLLPEPIKVLSTFLPYRYLHYDVVMTLFGRSYDPVPLVIWTLILAVLERIVRKRAMEAMEAWGG